jgi:hypothetical protein
VSARAFRTSFEVVGLAAILALHTVIAILYALGSTLIADPTHRLVYWAAIVLGYTAMAVVAAGRRRILGDVPWRSTLDAWLIAFPVTAAVVALVTTRWPLRLSGWNAHGMGASGGEANSVFLPWIHLATWWLLATSWQRWRQGRV